MSFPQMSLLNHVPTTAADALVMYQYAMHIALYKDDWPAPLRTQLARRIETFRRIRAAYNEMSRQESP